VNPRRKAEERLPTEFGVAELAGQLKNEVNIFEWQPIKAILKADAIFGIYLPMVQGVKKVPGPLLSPGALDFMPISPSRVIRENHTRQAIIKSSRRDNHKMK
jgi:hypothetical protein